MKHIPIICAALLCAATPALAQSSPQADLQAALAQQIGGLAIQNAQLQVEVKTLHAENGKLKADAAKPADKPAPDTAPKP